MERKVTTFAKSPIYEYVRMKKVSKNKPILTLDEIIRKLRIARIEDLKGVPINFKLENSQKF
jgi:hypothetical protein